MADTITRHTPLADLPELLRAEEAASFLGISRGLVYEMVRRADLPSVRLGRLLRIPRTALMNVNGHTHEGDR